MLAYDIAIGQSGQRGEMFDWLVQWGLPQAGEPMAWMTESDAGHNDHGGASSAPIKDEETRKAMGLASAAEISALEDASGHEADCMFLELVIRHHEGAISMATAAIELGSHPARAPGGAEHESRPDRGDRRD